MFSPQQLEKAFLSQVLSNEGPENDILDTTVTTESLITILQSLNTKSSSLQHELLREVNNNFEEFSSSFHKSQNIHKKTIELVKQIPIEEAELKTTQTQVHSTLDEYHSIVLESKKNQQTIDALTDIVDILERIEDIQNQLGIGSYKEATNNLLEITKYLDGWPMEEAGVKALLKQKTAGLRQDIISQLQEGIHQSVHFENGQIDISKHMNSKEKEASYMDTMTILQCLNKFDMLAGELMKIQRQIFKSIIIPYFQSMHTDVKVQEMNDGNTARLQIVQLENRKEDEVYYKDPIDTLKQVDRILGYFYKYMFNGNNAADGICLVFGNLLLCDLIKMMISKSLQPAIPSSDGTLSDFDRIAKAAKVFEDRCITAYGFQLKSVDTNTLSNYVDNIDKHYAKKRREKILTNGRNVMLRKLYDSEPVEVREDIHLQHYQITQTPQLISVLISDTISEASNLMHSHPISASNLIEGVHDLLDMYRSITPSYHRSQFLSSPATSLVFRNDCYWLANKLTNSISKMKEVKLFDNLLSIINNAAMKLQELGKAWYELTMLQRMQMIQMLHTSFDGFTGIAEDPKQQKQCENTLFGIIELTKSFAVETRSVVDVNLFMDMMGRIVDNVIMIFIKDIEDLHDIGATDSHVIAVHLNSMAQLVSAFDLPDKDATDSFVAELVPNWQKFWLIKDILEMNMKEIMEAFRQGDLHMFEKSELVNLVCALFADTELRESNLREIQKSGTYRADDQADASNSFLPYTQSPSTNQSARSVSPSLSTSSASRSTSGLEYNMDDMDEMEIGWEEEEDLFQDNSYPVEYDKEKTETESINSKLSMSLDDLNDEELSGWGDADESLFKEDQLSNMATSQPVTSSSSKSPQVTTVSPSLNKTKTPTMHPETTSSLLSAPELEIDEEDGWGWEDEDLFIKDPK